jgi:large subunit ribosomal protein L22
MTGPKTNERPGTRAFLRSAPMSAYKVREVLDLIRGQEVQRAAEILQFCERGAAETVGKVLASAVANAAHNDELDPEELFVTACFADEAKTQRRMRPRARGRATRIRKRSAHITIIVSRLPEERLVRLRAKRVAEQAARRTRRGRGAGGPAPDRARRVRRGRAAEAAAAGEPEVLETPALPPGEPVDDVVEPEAGGDLIEPDLIGTGVVEDDAGEEAAPVEDAPVEDMAADAEQGEDAEPEGSAE